MSPARVTKQVVCSECGRPLRVEKTSACVIERDDVVEDDEIGEDTVISGRGEAIETVVELGPVCPRCAGVG